MVKALSNNGDFKNQGKKSNSDKSASQVKETTLPFDFLQDNNSAILAQKESGNIFLDLIDDILSFAFGEEEKEEQEEKPKLVQTTKENEAWDGDFELNANGKKVIASMDGLGSDETKKQTVQYNKDGTATIYTYFINENGCDNIADETTTVEFVKYIPDGLTEEECKEYGIQSYKPQITNSEFNIDKNIDFIKQGEAGDCWFLSCINSLKYSGEKGQKIIDDAISINDDGTYSVTFKGIDETYTFNQEELTKARESGKYSTGDNTMLLLEAAADKAMNDIYDEYKSTNNHDDSKDNNKAKIGSMLDYDIKKGIKGGVFRGGTVEYFGLLFGLSNEEYNFQNSDFDSYVKSISFASPNASESGVFAVLKSDNNKDFELENNHAYAIKSYDKENKTITIVNPWDSSDSLTISTDKSKEYIAIIESCKIEYEQ